MDNAQIRMLLKWRSRYKRAQLSHSYTAVRYRLYDTILGVFLIFLTTASAVLIFSDSEIVPWLSPLVGITAALFAFLQTFLRFNEKSEDHRSVERKYGALKKEIEFILRFCKDDEDLKSIINEIRIRENNISMDAPHSIVSCWKKAKKETLTENDENSIRMG